MRYCLNCSSRRRASRGRRATIRSEEHTSEPQSPCNLVCRLVLEKKKQFELINRIVIENYIQLQSGATEYPPRKPARICHTASSRSVCSRRRSSDPPAVTLISRCP